MTNSDQSKDAALPGRPLRSFDYGLWAPAQDANPPLTQSGSATFRPKRELTSQPPAAGFPLTYPLPSAELPKPSWVKISQIRTLSVDRLGEKLGEALLEDLDQIIAGLNEIIGN